MHMRTKIQLPRLWRKQNSLLADESIHTGPDPVECILAYIENDMVELFQTDMGGMSMDFLPDIH